MIKCSSRGACQGLLQISWTIEHSVEVFKKIICEEMHSKVWVDTV